jgi:hypothetical protein
MKKLAGIRETFAPRAVVCEPRGYHVSRIPRPDGNVQLRESFLAVRQS